MSAIRATGNQTTELAVTKLLREWGLKGWRRHQPLPGRPDFIWRTRRIALFVDGCFWHGCPSCYLPPRSHATFWRRKLEANKARDRRVSRELRARGWTVLRVWECRIGSPAFRRRLHDCLAD